MTRTAPSPAPSWRRRPPLTAEGTARRNPADTPVAEIGDELAVGRALLALGEQLLNAAAGDIAALR